MLASGLGLMLLLRSPELGEGIRRGLRLCSESVIPSLFPFMALSVYICKSSAADFFAVLFRPLTRILKLPEICGGVLLSSVFGGYPAAAKNIADLCAEGSLEPQTGAKMLCYCVNAGPPFLISAVGISVFGSFRAGVLLFFAQILSSAFIALFIAVFSKKPEESPLVVFREKRSNSVCAAEAVVSAAESCFRMCAFIVLTCGVLDVCAGGSVFSAAESPAAKAVLSGFFEVTAGAFSCGGVPGFAGIILAGAICSFSGVSVILQIAAVTDKSGIPLFPFIISRFFHAGITAALLRLFFSFSKEAAGAFSVRGSDTEALLSSSAPAAVSLLCMAALFLLSLVPPKSEKEPLFSRILTKITIIKHGKTGRNVLKWFYRN